MPKTGVDAQRGRSVLDVAQDVLSNYYNYVGKTTILINDNFFVVSSSQLIKSITHNVKDLYRGWGPKKRDRQQATTQLY